MKNWKRLLTVLPGLALFALPLVSVSVSAQDPQSSALWRGYRTGYSDGYPSGAADLSNGAPRDFRGKPEYKHADRAYVATYGSLDDFRDGYQQGFEAGYSAGYERRGFDSAVPPDIQRRAQTDSDTVADNPSGPILRNAKNPNNTEPPSGNSIGIPRDTVMRVELMTNLSSKDSKAGDTFQARVIEPKEYDGGVVNGRVTQVKRAGKVKGASQLQLSFDEIRMSDGRYARLSAQVIEVIPMSNSQNVGRVDSEGGVRGKSSTKGDVEKIGAGVGIGAVIGAIAGGGAGAAIGAAIGGGVGTAGVLTERGSDIHLWEGQQLRIRTAGDTAIQ
jgi:hypothetical protein